MYYYLKKFFNLNLSLFIVLTFSTSCDNSNSPIENESIDSSINIYAVYKQLTPLSVDQNGFYHFPYNPTGTSASDYGTVYYTTSSPMTLVSWFSPDSFYVQHMGQTFGEPIINYSTYSGDDGDSQQLFYVNSQLIGDTLDIYGYYYSSSNLIIDSVKVIIED